MKEVKKKDWSFQTFKHTQNNVSQKQIRNAYVYDLN